MHDQLSRTLKLKSAHQEAQSNNQISEIAPDLDICTELEATIEELVAASEQLEAANEHLQSANEELETTNEELLTLNEELENMHEELEDRTCEISRLNSRFVSTLEQLPWPVTLIENNQNILFCNRAALAFFGLKDISLVGLHLSQVPLDNGLKKSLITCHSYVLKKLKPISLNERLLKCSRSTGLFDIDFLLVMCEGVSASVLMTISPSEPRTKQPQTVKGKVKSISPPRRR
jgi:PAS domain-containing protein